MLVPYILYRKPFTQCAHFSGPEVARYLQAHFGEQVKGSEALASGDVKTALVSTFLAIDQTILTDAAQKELRQYASVYIIANHCY